MTDDAPAPTKGTKAVKPRRKKANVDPDAEPLRRSTRERRPTQILNDESESKAEPVARKRKPAKAATSEPVARKEKSAKTTEGAGRTVYKPPSDDENDVKPAKKTTRKRKAKPVDESADENDVKPAKKKTNKRKTKPVDESDADSSVKPAKKTTSKRKSKPVGKSDANSDAKPAKKTTRKRKAKPVDDTESEAEKSENEGEGNGKAKKRKLPPAAKKEALSAADKAVKAIKATIAKVLNAEPAKSKSAKSPSDAQIEELSKLNVQQLKAVLRHNDQILKGTKGDLMNRVIDRLINGNLPKCPECGGGKLASVRIEKGHEVFRCPGFYDDDQFKSCNRTFMAPNVTRTPWMLEGPLL